MKIIHAALAIALSVAGESAAHAAMPLLFPSRDVTVDYTVHPRDNAPLAVRVSIEAGGAHLRITSAELPTAFLVDRPAHTATILLPLLKLYATVGIARFDPQETVLKHAQFQRHGQHHIAGHVCTDWTAFSAQGRAEACITEDGVILSGSAADAQGSLGAVQASTVMYGGLPPVLFRLPAGYRNAGSLPVDGFSGAGR
jgi:hypothetical protein